MIVQMKKYPVTVMVDMSDMRRFQHLCKKHDMTEDEMFSYIIGISSAIAMTRQEESDCILGFLE